MKKRHLIFQSRENLDALFKRIGPAGLYKPPVRGWIKAIREALGMSSAQLAKRVGIKQPTIIAIEQSELKETIQLATLRRVAAAMNCTLVYALVPNQPLEKIVEERAHKVAQKRFKPVQHSMLLEGQEVPPKKFKKRMDELAENVSPRALWDDE